MCSLGTGWLQMKGVVVEKGQGKTRVYPFETKCDLRSHTQTINFAERALGTSTPVMGVKGPSVLSLLPGFDIINGCIPDYIHCVLLGVARACANLWFCGENSGKPCVPVLKGTLPERFPVHWAKLMNGVVLLLSESITSEGITKAEKLLNAFVQEVEGLYGVCNMTFNIHLCLHLAQSVKDWGPLWTHSAFAFENYNRDLLEMVKSTQGVTLQI
ncbi:DNA ligase [Labeo rohita]|uniref:DNA ligase n=1 Tax=Labeo rohita TaxID=84645 RepID=A0ABQ8L4Z2_LABRO|nr:DNA ligase [Labeo rohita]